MFGLPSFPKLTLLLFALAAIWFIFRWFGRQERSQKEGAGTQNRRGRGRDSVEAVDMVQCKVCDAFVPRTNPSACERAGCPY